MNKIIRLELLHQDVMLIKNPKTADEISSEIDFFLEEHIADDVANELMKVKTAFREWHTEVGIKNLLVVSDESSVGTVSRVTFHTADKILENKGIDSKEMHALLVQQIMDGIYEKV